VTRIHAVTGLAVSREGPLPSTSAPPNGATCPAWGWNFGRRDTESACKHPAGGDVFGCPKALHFRGNESGGAAAGSKPWALVHPVYSRDGNCDRL